MLGLHTVLSYLHGDAGVIGFSVEPTPQAVQSIGMGAKFCLVGWNYGAVLVLARVGWP